MTTIAAAAERPRPPAVEISEEFGRSRRPSSADGIISEGIEPTAAQL